MQEKYCYYPGYNAQEVELLADEKKKKTVKEPMKFYFNVTNADVEPHMKDYENFESAQGLIKIEKACDKFGDQHLRVRIILRHNLRK